MSFTRPHAAPRPACVEDLNEAERFALRTFRRWAMGFEGDPDRHLPCVWREFIARLGTEDARAALAAFAALVRELVSASRRPIAYHRPCCPCLGAAELSFLGFVAACQHRRWGLARALAEWMVRADGVGGMLEAGARFARLMDRHALRFPERDERVMPEPDREPLELPGRIVH